MANRENHETQQLANRLVAAADGITNQAAVGLERDLREAAEVVRDVDRPAALLPRLLSELAKIANGTSDPEARRRLHRLIGEQQQ
jgi:hypothetical protein